MTELKKIIWYLLGIFLYQMNPFHSKLGKQCNVLIIHYVFIFFLNSKFGKQYSIFKIQSIKLYLSFCGECDCLGKYIRIINNFI